MDSRSLDMRWTRSADIVDIKLVGQNDRQTDLRYTLTVTADSNTTNKGSVRLRDSRPVSVATVRVQSKGPWRAELRVEGDETYVISAP